MAEKAAKSPWMEITLERQLSDERDFPAGSEVKRTYGILCGHRMGSNLLSETLFLTGLMGDPMEFFNKRWLTKFFDKHGAQYSNFDLFYKFLQSRRTSPNGTFGYNLKVDQFRGILPGRFGSDQVGRRLLRDTEKFVFLRRRDRLDQAISAYIGRSRDTFRIPAEANVSEIHEIVQDVPFEPGRITEHLHSLVNHDRAWETFLQKTPKPWIEIYYEDLVSDFDGTIRKVVSFVVGEQDFEMPEQPTAKIAGAKNQELKQLFLEHIAPSRS